MVAEPVRKQGLDGQGKSGSRMTICSRHKHGTNVGTELVVDRVSVVSGVNELGFVNELGLG